jgi:hypothetical protein
VQRELVANTVLTVAYVGMKGTHVLVTENINAALPGPGAVAARRPYPNLGDGTAVGDWGNSTYHSLQTTVQRRFSSGLSMLAAWTWSHSIDNTSGTGSETVQTPYNLHLNRGNSTFDLRHNVALSWTYELPFAKRKSGPLQWIAGGWQINSIDSFQSGTPFTVTMQSSLLNAGSGVQWPNRLASGSLANPTIARWFDPTAFLSPGNYLYGNSGRNILVGPRTTQFDVSLFKSFAFGQDRNALTGAGAVRRVQFRAEAFNLANTPQFNNPNASIGNLSVAQITSAGQPPLFQRTSREIQLALKLYW